MAEGPVRYQIRLRGGQRSGWNEVFEGATIVEEADSATMLLGVAADRLAFDSLLARARDLGLRLVSLHLGELERDVHRG